jgi:glycosyltransferase involved in cell wall biosynthesis
MRIAIFTDTYFPDINGVSSTLIHFTNHLESQGIVYKVFAPASRSGEYISEHIRRFKSFSLFLYPECRFALPNVRSLKSELEDFAPDIIHIATPFNMGLCGLYLSKKLNLPIVGSYHTNFDHYLKYYNLSFLSSSLWKYMKWFHKPLKKIFVPSYETIGQLKRRGFRNTVLCPAGVDCTLYRPDYDQHSARKKYGLSRKFTLSFVGRLAPEKDLHTLMAIAHAIPAELTGQIDWLIIGDGPLRAELEEQAPANMKFTGYLTGSDLAEAYSVSDLFVFPSPTETFGMVVLEALASGTPAVAANSGGVKNIIKTGKTGFTCEPGNVAAFTEAIVHLLKNDRLRIKFQAEARMYALEQSWDAIFQNMLWHYQDISDTKESSQHA